MFKETCEPLNLCLRTIGTVPSNEGLIVTPSNEGVTKVTGKEEEMSPDKSFRMFHSLLHRRGNEGTNNLILTKLLSLIHGFKKY